ncbi:hypothetical protein [Bradyrhizobium sp. CIR3A]|uniref:hypothetical protein n=1 Tax=Bradyrhizobium sp. CIR3A TaxID=2663838 RepID=UPI001606738B|nr:hypothetical protein [Bradyrhizobium sp. CIR3A]MBB4261561.1 hypothetical protein [Bradyrhizobium sp. CIR3A]
MFGLHRAARRTHLGREIRKLADLGFIKLQLGQAGLLSHAPIMNPHLVIKKMYEDGQPGLSKEKYRGLEDRAHEIAATDLDDDHLDDDEKEEAAAAASAPTAPALVVKKAVPKRLLRKSSRLDR